MNRVPVLAGIGIAASLAIAAWFWFGVHYGSMSGPEITYPELEADSIVPLERLESNGGGSASADALTRNDASVDLRGAIRRRAEEERRQFALPSDPPLRSLTGAVDPLQCTMGGVECDTDDPLRAESWPESQWMREHGFIDEQQRATAQGWSDAELDSRYRSGDPAAMLELARRFSLNGEDIAARTLLQDAVSLGNVRAAHELARSESGIRSAHSRPGLQWLFVARRMGDGKVDLTYMRSQFPDLRDGEIDHAMLVADRYSLQLGLFRRPVQPRPERP